MEWALLGGGIYIFGISAGRTTFYRPRSEGDNVLGSVRPSVRPSVWVYPGQRSRLCRVRQRAKKSHYQFKVFVCVPNSRADAVDRLLI